ncbi:MAG TPA: ImmA/IrrE family metallo-endopeptidase [Planctomycetota bacterium]|nr:ImmA/IrrE family metallo-endopeptidase [Planctomycetota bacterium]
MGKLPVPVLSYNAIAREANNFLRQHHPSGSIPIPIEEIIDLKLKLDIFPMPGLLKSIDIDGFTTSDLKCICVDEFVYSSRPTRYRFTLAHELGHIILHQKIFELAKFRTVAEWKRFYKNIPEEDRGWLEYQAYAFGGLVLVPSAALGPEFEKCVATVKRKGGALLKDAEVTQYFVEDCLADVFQVSREVISKRLVKDGLDRQIPGARK